MALPDWMKKALSKGFSLKDIKEHLLNHGYTEADVRHAFEHSLHEDPEPEPFPWHASIILIVGIVAAFGVLGITIATLMDIPEQPEIAMVSICGDGECDTGEVCCNDCGCAGELDCINNACREPDLCELNEECDDGKSYTLDACIGTPKKCKNIPTTQCKGLDDYCPSGCTVNNDADCTPKPMENCRTILKNGPNADKLDIVFVMDASYKYLPKPLEEFRKDIETHIRKRGLGLLEIKPWDVFEKKLNIYAVDELSEDIRCGEGKKSCAETAYRHAQKCPVDKTVVLVRAGDAGFSPSENVAVSYSCDGTEQKFLTGTQLQGWKCPATTNNPLITAHELSHTLGLWDVYPLLTTSNTPLRMPNCDTEGCPRWCTKWDLTNYKQAKKFCRMQNYEDSCKRAAFYDPNDVRKKLYDCNWIEESCTAGVGYEDVCRGAAKSGVGCYLNCGGIKGWRPVQEGTLMGAEIPGRVERSLSYDPISLEAIYTALNAYE